MEKILNIKMKKILIITLYSNENFGNKLQNYALQEYIKNLNPNFDVKTGKIKYERHTDNKIEFFLWRIYNSLKKNNKKGYP